MESNIVGSANLYQDFFENLSVESNIFKVARFQCKEKNCEENKKRTATSYAKSSVMGPFIKIMASHGLFSHH